MSMQVKARGVYDTTPTPIVVGAYAVVLTDYVLFPRALKTDAAPGADKLVMRAEAAGEVVVGTDKAYVYAPSTSPARASLPLPPGAVTMGAGVSPAFTEATADKIFARVSSLSIGWKNRNRNLRAITNYLDSTDMPVAGAQVCLRVGWKLDNGNWVENDVVKAPVGAALTTISTTMVPAGERLGRIRIWTDAGGLSSRAHVLYFKFSA